MKNYLWKRITAWLLCAALLAACMPNTVIGAFAETVADETTEAAGDLLAGASAADSVGIFFGGPHSYDRKSSFVSGEESLYSWKFSTTAEGTGWPTALLNLNQAVDMTGKYLAVDVYADGARDYLSVVSIYTSGWGSLNDSQWPPNYVQSDFGAGKWVTLYFDLTTALAEGKDLTDVGIIKFCFDFETNAGTEQAVYLDNLRLVDEIPAEPEVTEAPTEPEVTEAPTEPQPQDENDLLANCSGIVYNKDHWAEGTGLTVAPNTENITGEGSIRSFAFTADETVSTTLAAAQFHLGQSYDMTGKNLAFDVKYVADTREQQQIGVRLHMNSWGNINDINRILKINPGDWRTVVVDFTSVINAGRDLSDISLITFHFDFSNNTGVERTIYIDNVRIVTDEQTQLIEDPLPEPQDENDMLGQTENISYNKPHWENVDNGVDSDGNPIDDVTTGLTCGRDTDHITGEGSIRSWYFAATAEASFEHAVAQLRLGQSYDMTGKSLAFDVKFD